MNILFYGNCQIFSILHTLNLPKTYTIFHFECFNPINKKEFTEAIIKSNIIAKNNLNLNLNVNNILFNSDNNNINFLNETDNNNLNYIINLSNNIIMKNNNFSLTDKNIIKLDNIISLQDYM